MKRQDPLLFEPSTASTHRLSRLSVLLFTAFVLVALPALAQEPTTNAPGCGPEAEQFDVKTMKTAPALNVSDNGKAIIYFLQDERYFQSRPRPTVRFGIDGAWAGATHANSYFQVAVEPGEHHLCAAWQSSVGVGLGKQRAALHFTAEPGKVYYFPARDYWNRVEGAGEIEFDRLDSDQGRLMIGSYSYSTFQKRK